MAKKGKDDVPNPNSVANRDIIQRLNFLYQASELLGSMSTGARQETQPEAGPVTSDTGSSQKRKICRRQHPKSLLDLSRTYVRSMKSIGTKTNVRMCAEPQVEFGSVLTTQFCRDPAIKRTLCKGCNAVLIPGKTATVRVTCRPIFLHVEPC